MTIPAGFGQISVVHTGGGIVGEAIWTMGFENDADMTASAVADAVDAILIAQDYPDLISSSVDIRTIRVKLGPDATGPAAEATSAMVGTVGGHAAPPNVAILVGKQTALGGRQGRGRLYVPGQPEANLGNGGTLEPGVAGMALTFFESFGGLMSLGGLPLHLLHGDALAPTAIDSFSVSNIFATQRRRMRR